ncbi:pyocin activator protein PrtN [Acinetobacter pittii]|uniref:pyocin activator PrtN family protein n=1 Tax=Acinetobacter pittii TaxID=48296 RepID=UPI00070AA220|nr:pyocin activator PrtN family protein [Acinetobacter pittii]KRI49471.1 pyocin activator protein PrtN [Acinetobacter pittii]
MAAVKKIDDPFDTLLLLQMKYRKPVVTLEELLPDYLPHLSPPQANKRANKCDLPFPVFKPDGKYSPWCAHINDVALWLKSKQEEARADWRAMHS